MCTHVYTYIHTHIHTHTKPVLDKMPYNNVDRCYLVYSTTIPSILLVGFFLYIIYKQYLFHIVAWLRVLKI